ncbi:MULTISPECIES: ABC transporter permease [Roseicella]|uniref:Transport permease protein n=2 Tax=Roseicella TaxID=2730923 RepID=A0A9X1IIY1_9PROT|nr:MULTISPECIES: ABC transporter permease [Roseicella]MCB4824218.1 ABC transporter permease [Roseicella aerolata]RAI56056.1 multidrug ABC transporter permease [Roseicella frigidaeris]
MAAPQPKGPITAEGINWIGLWTLYRREVRRFLAVAAQTVAGPVVTTLLFLAVFAVVMSRRGPPQPIGDVSYLEFLAAGLVVMTMAQNAFANTSSSLLIAKVQGNIVDLLVAPLSPMELVAGFALGAVTRGLLVGAAVALAMGPFVSFRVAHPGFVVFHALAACLLLGLLGILGGLWAQKMDHLGAVTSFVVTPLTFLSGTFYSVADLPPSFQAVAHANPFFYMIDGFRYGITGHADGSLAVGLAVMAGANLLLAVVSWRLMTAGWRLTA